MTDRDQRQIMIRPETRVEAIPPALLREVYGLVTPDPRVEFLVLSFEYWLNGGATPSLQRREMLRLLPHNLDENNAYRLVALLAKQLGVRPEGWEEVVGDYALDGHRSVADVVDADSLQKVRDFKKAKKTRSAGATRAAPTSSS